jgi:hypothetical protein
VSWTLEGEKAASAGKEEKTSSESTPESSKSIGELLGGLAGKIIPKVLLRSLQRVLTNDEYMNEFGEVMKI